MQSDEMLRELITRLRVDADAGRVYWAIAPRTHPRLLGQEAGGARAETGRKTYRWVVRFSGKGIKRAHVIFFSVHNYLPEIVDHRNRNSLDDRIDNLRAADSLKNAWNHSPPAKTTRLPAGVKLLASGNFQARIGIQGKQLALGSFPTPEEAAGTYQAKRKELYGEFA